ncbi:MAG: nickel-responsive transcriptional regulator NikR [Methylocella sp.]
MEKISKDRKADHAPIAREDANGQRPLVSRISISLSEDLLQELDLMVGDRGFASRSQAVSTILHRSLTEHRHKMGDRVMVGTITLFYNHLAAEIEQKLADLQRRHIDEVISSLHVHLEQNQTLEVVLVQGRADKLQQIADEMIVQKGVISGHLQLAAALIPPIHQM